ncbi:hypothetical protein CY34DRAFT_80540 [Suillus luteus UH-Slu-Lm8-n1]|uniref:DUF7702 domain-containing protein n=1 Tax=Suillus luteus UH-Slu-Lm8-n1 TaxID=930992 RepID=A0A0D0B293_9AGAM|nr:hypothetical protein CY34DRAFT_80540 [Suillus luteus UH-Slu-Lm8-n1]
MDKIQSPIILAAVKLATYVPLSIVSFVIVFRHGISRGDGWVLLSIFCITQLVGGILYFLSFFSSYTSLDNGAYALEASGLSPLLLCTLGLLHSIFQTPDGFLRYQAYFRLLQLLGTVAFCLNFFSIYFVMIKGTTSNTNAMVLAGVILYAILYIILVGICLYLWTQIRFVMRYRKQLLKAVSVALPFLTVRTVYSVLFMLWMDRNPGSTPLDLGEFDLIEGNWQIYIAMKMLMEYAVVIIYSVAAFVLPLKKDYKIPESYQDEYLLSRPHC